MDQSFQKSLSILGVDVLALSMGDAQDMAHGYVTSGADEVGRIAFLNAHGANLAQVDVGFAAALGQCDVICDGVGLDIAAKILYGAPFPFNQNGSDFLPRFFAGAPRSYRVGLLGGEDGVAAHAAQVWAQHFPAHEFVCIHHGFFDEAEESDILDRLKADRVDVLLVAFGNPRQEKWIVEHISKHHCDLAFGVGALLDFTAGRMHRAPVWVQRLRLEWVYRLAQEPRRLFKRYVMGNPLFLLAVLKQKLFAGRPE